jgi:hypothetical protein
VTKLAPPSIGQDSPATGAPLAKPHLPITNATQSPSIRSHPTVHLACIGTTKIHQSCHLKNQIMRRQTVCYRGHRIPSSREAGCKVYRYSQIEVFSLHIATGRTGLALPHVVSIVSAENRRTHCKADQTMSNMSFGQSLTSIGSLPKFTECRSENLVCRELISKIVSVCPESVQNLSNICPTP